MRKHLIIIRDIFLMKIDSRKEALALEWKYYAQTARIWRQYKEVVSLTLDGSHGQAADQLHHSSIEEEFLAVIETRKIIRLAAHYGFEMPDKSKAGNYGEIAWDYDHAQPKFLTEQGMSTARKALKVARKESREAAGFWFGIIVGVIGALTGLMAVMS